MIRALVTTATPLSVDGAVALIRSFRRQHAGADVYVIVTDGVQLDLPVKMFPVSQLAGHTGLALGSCLDPENQALFALPFGLEQALTEQPAVVYVAPGCLVAHPLEELAAAMETAQLALVSPSLAEEVHSLTPHLHTLTRRRELITDRVIGATSGAIAHLGYLQAALVEGFIDVYQRRPSDIVQGLLGMLVGQPGVRVAGRRTLTTWVDFAAVESGRASGEPVAVVSCDRLLQVARQSMSDDAEDVEVAWQLLADNVHDSRPLEPLVALIEKAVRSHPVSSHAWTPFSDFVTEVRRGADPWGVRWPDGEAEDFMRWLYERNPAGLTRIAHLYWRGREELFENIAKPTHDPSPLQRWNTKDAPYELGADLFDPGVRPGPPIKSLEARTGSMGRLRTALVWRLNLLAGLLPGYERRQKTRRLGPDPGEKRGVAPPRRVHVTHKPSVFGDPPRSLSLIGCFRSESGLGQAARASLEALRLLGREFSYIDTSELYPSRNAIDPRLDRVPFGAFGDVNLAHTNADELLTLGQQVFRHRLSGRFTAAMWFWETADLPERSRPAFDCIDELWVASEYLVDVFGQYAKVPVHNIGLAADLPRPREVPRTEFGLPEGELLFLFVYDALSAHGRKNPEKALQAFIRAFRPGFEGVRFVLKVSNLNKFPASEKRLRALAATTPAITLIDEYFQRERVLDLMATADVYVSLHAAEGFGLTLLEAMAVRTPAICTAYSGNMDFTTPENSWLVDFTMMATEKQTGPYPPGSVWASPNQDSVVDLMRAIRDNPADLARKRERAVVDAREVASLERYAKNLDAHLQRVL